MSKVPADWLSGKVSDFLVLQRGFDLTKKQALNGNIPVYSSSGLAYYHNEAKVKGPGVITGRKGSVGPVYFVEEDFWPHDTTLWVKDFKGNLPEYVKIFLHSMELSKYDEASSVPTLNRNNVHCVRCAFPPLPEQTKIVQILSTWDKAIATTEKLIGNSQQQKKALMQSLLTGKKRLPGFEGEWSETLLGDIAYITTGNSNRQDSNLDGNYAFFDRSEDVRTSNIYLFDCEAVIVPGEGQDFVPKYFHGKFDLHQRTYAIMNINGCDAKFIFFAISYFRGYLLSQAVGSTVKSLRLPMFKKMPLVLPPLPEQQKIAAVLTAADNEIELLQKKLAFLKQEKAALMQQLLTGKRRVKINPTEECMDA